MPSSPEKYSGRTYANFWRSSGFCFSDLGIMLNFMEPTSSRNIAAFSPVKASWRSSRIVAATKREVSALDLRVLKTS